ncbi:MAG: hypothetical protein H6652_04000 [Ardenticatenaceae bacterium]|nr:hypothetical protein [Ardenticatenaceae bacterium]
MTLLPDGVTLLTLGCSGDLQIWQPGNGRITPSTNPIPTEIASGYVEGRRSSFEGQHRHLAPVAQRATVGGGGEWRPIGTNYNDRTINKKYDQRRNIRPLPNQKQAGTGGHGQRLSRLRPQFFGAMWR